MYLSKLNLCMWLQIIPQNIWGDRQCSGKFSSPPLICRNKWPSSHQCPFNPEEGGPGHTEQARYSVDIFSKRNIITPAWNLTSILLSSCHYTDEAIHTPQFLNSCYFLNAKYQVSHPHKTAYAPWYVLSGTHFNFQVLEPPRPPDAGPPHRGLTFIETARKNNHSKVILWMDHRQNELERALSGKAVGEDMPRWHVVDRKAGYCALLRYTWLQSTSSLNDSIGSILILFSHLGKSLFNINSLP